MSAHDDLLRAAKATASHLEQYLHLRDGWVTIGCMLSAEDLPALQAAIARAEAEKPAPSPVSKEEIEEAIDAVIETVIHGSVASMLTAHPEFAEKYGEAFALIRRALGTDLALNARLAKLRGKP